MSTPPCTRPCWNWLSHTLDCQIFGLAPWGHHLTSLLLHVANCTAMQVATDYATADFIPPVGPLPIGVRTARKPVQVTLEPLGTPLAGKWENGLWSGRLERLDVHAIVAFTV